MYAVCVTFQIEAGHFEAFMPLMQENAKTSLHIEEGCHQFDVLTDASRPNAVFLYELYTNRAAFDAHLASAHFQSFDAAVAPIIAEKEVQTWDGISQ